MYERHTGAILTLSYVLTWLSLKQPKKFWSYIRKIFKERLYWEANSHMVTDNLRVLNAQFHSVFTNEYLTTFPEKGPVRLYPLISAGYHYPVVVRLRCA